MSWQRWKFLAASLSLRLKIESKLLYSARATENPEHALQHRLCPAVGLPLEATGFQFGTCNRYRLIHYRRVSADRSVIGKSDLQ